MNNDADSESLSKGKGKGKARALDTPTESTPLLPSPSSSLIYDVDRSPSPTTARRRLVAQLVYVFSITLCVSIVVLIGFAFIAWSYAAQVSQISPETVLNDAMKFKGPNRVDVLNVTESGGIWTRIDGQLGLDAGRAIGVNSDDEDSLFREMWKAFGRWGIRKVDVVSVRLCKIRLVSDDGELLATVDIPPQQVVLTVDPPYGSSWLQSVSTTVFVQPTRNTTDLVSFFSDAWRTGTAMVNIEVGTVSIQGGALGELSWRNKIHDQFFDIKTYVALHVPQIPGLPQPGRGVPFPPIADLITLETFSVSTVEDQLALYARATLVDPAPLSFNFTAPPLPFSVSLPPDVPIAAVTTAPFTTTHPNITIDITGSALPLPSSSSHLLSSFLSRYLSALPNAIILSTPLISNLDIEAEFPAPHPRPRVLRNVTIYDMKIKPGNVFLASGVVFARVVLPRGMNISLDVTHVLPDVLVFDGQAPDTYWPRLLADPPPTPPLPDPLPERAFAHIRPDDWLESRCASIPLEPGEEVDGGAAYAVTARIEDVPLEVLPGRQTEFSNFVSKVVFGKDGALAGLVGTVAVEVEVPGLPVAEGGLVLEGLPFQGSVRIGKKNMFRMPGWGWPF
ncbi:hypothetical protein BDZ89DRAFT_1069634, partial [Hymenopellis radicata]